MEGDRWLPIRGRGGREEPPPPAEPDPSGELATRDPETSPDDAGIPVGLTRRRLLTGAAGAAGAFLLGDGVVRGHEAASRGNPLTEPSGAPPPGQAAGPRRPGREPSALGTRSPHETPRRSPRGGSSGTPHEELMGTITPSDLHFERHHGGIPDIDPAAWSLLVHGMVERPMVFTLSELRRFPSVSVVRFLECAGNYRVNAPEETPPSQVAPLTSNSEWTGVPLATLFREVGLLPGATWFLAEGADGILYSRSIPVEKAMEDSLLAWGQNGEALRPEQGYPVRLLNPGWEGSSSVKWIRRIKLADRPFMTRDETSRYTEPIRGGGIRQFSFVMDARSLITSPSWPMRMEPGWVEIQGIAWSGRGRIARVEISLDDGRSWVPADLQEPVLPRAHTRFRFPWRWDGRETAIWSRAVDETGYVQPSQAGWIEEWGEESGPYHRNPTTGWRIRSDGQVVYRTQEWGA